MRLVADEITAKDRQVAEYNRLAAQFNKDVGDYNFKEQL
jgi:hypothetical protein